MKKLKKKILHAVIRNPLFRPLKRAVRLLQEEVVAERAQSLKNAEEVLFKDLTVKTGFFKGLKYPDIYAFGSALYPKFVGSYEKELHGAFEHLLKNEYKTIVDIGCAEGYYAVGLAIKCPQATVYAFETEELPRAFCQKMVEANHVENRVILNGKCTPEILDRLQLQNALILCDVEGYEDELFNPRNISRFGSCDLVIELHAHVVPGIGDKLTALFSKSHNVSLVRGESRFHPDYESLFGSKDVSPEIKKYVLKEFRPERQNWLVLERKQ